MCFACEFAFERAVAPGVTVVGFAYAGGLPWQPPHPSVPCAMSQSARVSRRVHRLHRVRRAPVQPRLWQYVAVQVPPAAPTVPPVVL